MDPSNLRVTSFEDPAAFDRRVRAFLEASDAAEAANSLPLGIVAGLVNASMDVTDPLMLAAEDAQGVVGILLRTPPMPAVLALSEPAIARALATHLRDASLPGVNGPRAPAEAFAEAYGQATGARWFERMATRVYRLDAVEPPMGVPGGMRPATPADRPLLLGFMRGFHEDAGATAPRGVEASLDAFLHGKERGLRVWEVDGAVVSMAGFMARSRHGVRVGAVYTPAPERRRGYAGALVAALSQELLDGGRRFCVLYTDLANPTSNALYQRIGYRPLLDAVEIAFEGGHLPKTFGSSS